MPTPIPPQIDCERHHPCLCAENVALAVEFYTKKLGFNLGFVSGEPPTFAGVNLDKVQLFLAQGTPSPKGCSVYFVVSDADEFYEFHRTQGVEILEEPHDQPYGLRDYRVRDLHGYELGFGHYIYNQGESVRIERVDIPLRLEKRLAALLQDLAVHKRMSLTSCLEEILLHTNEPLGDGVASPHTQATLRHIQMLKKKHGIDYDCHASYRFVEEQKP